MNRFQIRALRAEDAREAFSSGDPELDRFFRKFAAKNQFRHHIGSTYVAVQEGRILGFVTVAMTSIRIDEMPLSKQKGLPRYPLPALRLARLAVDQSEQSRGVGRRLLKAVFLMARDLADKAGCVGIVVDAKAEAVEFYRKYGFEEIELRAGALQERPRPVPMFLALGSIPAYSLIPTAISRSRRFLI